MSIELLDPEAAPKLPPPETFTMRHARAVSTILFIAGFVLVLSLASDFVKGLTAIVVIYAAAALLILGERVRALQTNLERTRAAAPVLYLRSFKVDQRDEGEVQRWKLREIAFVRDEESLAAVFSAIGPMIAIGQPGERLPQLGAARVYFAHEHWQAGVREMMARSKLVILRAADSEGFLWEVRNVIQNAPPTNVIFYFSERWNGGKLESEYRKFVERTREFFPVALPSAIRDEHFLVFEEDWTPRLTGTIRKRSWLNRFVSWMLVAPVWNYIRQQMLRRRLAKSLSSWFAARGLTPLRQRVFGFGAVALGGFCSGPLAPGVMIAWNYSRIGRRGVAAATALASLTVFAAVYGAKSLTPFGAWFSSDRSGVWLFASMALFSLAGYLMAKRLRPDRVDRHFALGGRGAPIWVAVPLIAVLAVVWLRMLL